MLILKKLKLKNRNFTKNSNGNVMTSNDVIYRQLTFIMKRNASFFFVNYVDFTMPFNVDFTMPFNVDFT